MTVAAYVRVSTEQQKAEGSHENQRERIQQWAAREGYDEIEWFEDIAISGQSDDRPAYQRLMDSYEAYDAVVVRELSRFGRDPLTVLQDIEEIVDMLDDRAVELDDPEKRREALSARRTIEEKPGVMDTEKLHQFASSLSSDD